MSKDKSPTWLYLYEELRKDIISGKSQEKNSWFIEEVKQRIGIKLSAEEEKEAINFLIAEGLIKQQNDGLASNTLPARSRRDTGFIEDYLEENRKPSVKTIKLEVIPTSKIRPEAKVYIPNIEDLWIRHYNLQLIDNIPYALSDSYIPYQLFSSLIPTLRNTTVDLYRLMTQVGYSPSRKEERLYSDMPTLEEREFLEILRLMRVQVIRLDCRVWSDNTLVEVCLLCDRADLYEFNYTMNMVI